MFKWNYLDEEQLRETIYNLGNQLQDQPIFGVFSQDQTKFIVTSTMDILYVDMKKKLEIDFDDQEEISCIQNILADDKHFYVLANKKQQRLGYYLFSVEIDNPTKEPVYLINWNNKLDIGNCDIQILTEKDKKKGTVSKYIVVSYKCIGINTFNVFVIDLQTGLIKYWHEGY